MTAIQSLKYDLVCGMDVTELSDKDRQEVKHKGKKKYFCSDPCKQCFVIAPDKYEGKPLIAMRGIWKVFMMGNSKIEVLRGLDLNIWEGDFVTIIGASGSGKSTALNMMGLLDRPSQGKIYWRGADVESWSEETRASMRAKAFGFVFQQYNLVSWLTAYENVTLPLVFSGRKVTKEVKKSFTEAGLLQRMGHRPAEMSGGEQQRVALLRSLVNNPLVVLGDEPTGNLDSKTGDRVLKMLIDLNKRQGKTLVVVTHDVDIAEQADQVIALKDGRLLRDHQAHKAIYTE